MPKYAVLIRHLPNNRPVTCAVIEESDDSSIDSMDHYLCSQAEDRIRRFVRDFPEFRQATWYVDLLHSHSSTPYETFETTTGKIL